MPSGNSLALSDLLRLAELTGDEQWRMKAERGFAAFARNLGRRPSGSRRGRSRASSAAIPLLEQKVPLGGKTTAYVCERGRCELPTSDPAVFARQIAKVRPLLEDGAPRRSRSAPRAKSPSPGPTTRIATATGTPATAIGTRAEPPAGAQ